MRRLISALAVVGVVLSSSVALAGPPIYVPPLAPARLIGPSVVRVHERVMFTVSRPASLHLCVKAGTSPLRCTAGLADHWLVRIGRGRTQNFTIRAGSVVFDRLIYHDVL